MAAIVSVSLLLILSLKLSGIVSEVLSRLNSAKIWKIFCHIICLHVSAICSGDLWSYNAEKDTYIVSPKPNVTVVDINEKHSFLILATDGLWQVVEPALAVNIVACLTAHMVMYCFVEFSINKN